MHVQRLCLPLSLSLSVRTVKKKTKKRGHFKAKVIDYRAPRHTSWARVDCPRLFFSLLSRSDESIHFCEERRGWCVNTVRSWCGGPVLLSRCRRCLGCCVKTAIVTQCSFVCGPQGLMGHYAEWPDSLPAARSLEGHKHNVVRPRPPLSLSSLAASLHITFLTYLTLPYQATSRGLVGKVTSALICV